MIDSMFQDGTDATLDDQVRRPLAPPPAASAFSLLGLGAAPFRGIGGGVAKSMAFGSEIVGAFGQTINALDSATPEQRRKNDRTGLPAPDMSNAVGDAFRQRAADIMPDPKTAHTSEQVVAGLFDFGTRAIGYAATTGPAAPFLLAGDVGLEESDRLKQQGVDLGTRTKAGAVAGTVAGVSVAVPLTGATAATRFVKGAAVGEGAIVGQSLAEREILRAAGYDKLADSFDPLDPVALAMGVVPGVLGAKFGHAAPKPLPKLRTEADVRAAAKLTPAEQAHENAYERSATNLAELERAIAAEKRPEVRALLEAELAKQRTAARESAVEAALQREPDLEPAVRVGQVADALDSSRLTPDADLAGRDAHVSAVELAADQMGRGEAVAVDHVVAPALLDAQANLRAFTEGNHPLLLDEQGGPVRLYHGTTADITELRSRADVHGADWMAGIYLTRDADYANQYTYKALTGKADYTGGNVLPVYVSMKNPKILEHDALGSTSVTREEVAALRAQGHDGIINKAGDEIVAFHPEQIKSAIGNSGSYDRKSASLTDPIARTAHAADQLRALREPPEPKAPPAQAAPEAPAKPEKAQPAQPAEPGQSAIARAAADAEALNPDMLVQLEGMDAPMRVGDLMERVREEAKQDTLAGRLIEVAAACDLTG